MVVKLLTEHHLEFLSLKGGCSGSSESTHVKMPHCWKSHALAQYYCVSLLKCPMVSSVILLFSISWSYDGGGTRVQFRFLSTVNSFYADRKNTINTQNRILAKILIQIS